MDRRKFFTSILSKTKQAATETVTEVVKQKLKRKFLRPPGAISEESFLLKCSRCGDCKTACPHSAVHLFGVDSGVNVNTPFVDPSYSACQFCEEMPCIKACEPSALDYENLKMGVARVSSQHCLVSQGQRCDYCFKSCPSGVDAISKGDEGVPVIDTNQCVGCGKCEYICVSQSGKAIEVEPVSNG